MRIDVDNLLEEDIRGIEDLDDVADVKYPTGCVSLNKKELLAKLSEIEFKMEGTWTHEFLDLFESRYRHMKAPELARLLSEKLKEIYDWDESVYYKILG